jgi:ribosomal protein S18 acetylase RimI-like enzyme
MTESVSSAVGSRVITRLLNPGFRVVQQARWCCSSDRLNSEMVAARPNSPAFALRPMMVADSEFAYAITREAMRECVEQTWGPWIEADQRERHARSFRAGQHDFIVVDGVELGLRALEWRHGCVYLARLYLRTPVQGQGIGAAVLRDLLAQARAAGRGVELQVLKVLKVNTGAQRFYARRGFERVGERPEYWEMRGV